MAAAWAAASKAILSIRSPLDEQVAGEEVELLAGSFVAAAAERRAARVDGARAEESRRACKHVLVRE